MYSLFEVIIGLILVQLMKQIEAVELNTREVSNPFTLI